MKIENIEREITEELIKRVLRLPAEDKKRLLAIWTSKISKVS